MLRWGGLGAGMRRDIGQGEAIFQDPGKSRGGERLEPSGGLLGPRSGVAQGARGRDNRLGGSGLGHGLLDEGRR